MTTSLLRGSQLPTFGHQPDYVQTRGDEAVALAQLLGIPLDEWQANYLRAALGEIPDPLNPGGYVWAATDCVLIVPRQSGKTFLIEVLILAALFLFHEKVVLTSQNKENSKKVLLSIADRIEKSPTSLGLKGKLLPERKWLVLNNGYEEIKLKSGASLSIRARGKDSGRGGTFDRLVNDESYDVVDEDLGALLPVLSARPNPQTWWVSTPPLSAVTGEPFTKMRRRGREKDPGVVCWEWGAPDGPLDLDDRELWAKTNPAFNIRKREAVMASQRASMTDADFAREHLGQWPVRASDALITAEGWSALAHKESRRTGDLAFAVDTCGWGDKAVSSIVAYGIREDGLGHIELIDQRPGTDWVVSRVLELRDKYNPVAIGFDTKSPVGSLLIDLQKAGLDVPEDSDRPKYGELAIPGGNEFSPACVAFVDAVNQGTIRHRDQVEFNRAVPNGKTRKLGDSWAWDRFKSDIDISPLVAATLARWAYESRSHLVRLKPNPSAYLI
ncbi:hypothetical protein [Micromonospora sp. CA-246542]|uniref:hypothetical protein n=1 Tax=Micromonospora sp. CA-246542 TaxID=3239959 RepID=UPI003D9227FE